MPPSVTLLVPTLNEIEGMRQIMPRVRPEWLTQVLVSDGGSRDGTVDYARERGYDVVIQRRPGLRHAYIEAMPLVKGDAVLTFSPDGNCIPEQIPELTAKFAEGYDMVIASRYYGGLRSEDDDAVTRFGNWFFCTTINALHGAHYSDPMNILRIWRKELFYRLDLHLDETYAPERWWGTVLGVEPILSVRAAKARLRIGEIPGPEPARIGGERKLQIVRWGGAYFSQVLRELFYWRPRR
jgi:glycosyltransferase involved in cell wall biosynthesis